MVPSPPPLPFYVPPFIQRLPSPRPPHSSRERAAERDGPVPSTPPFQFGVTPPAAPSSSATVQPGCAASRRVAGVPSPTRPSQFGAMLPVVPPSPATFRPGCVISRGVWSAPPAVKCLLGLLVWAVFLPWIPSACRCLPLSGPRVGLGIGPLRAYRRAWYRLPGVGPCVCGPARARSPGVSARVFLLTVWRSPLCGAP